MANHLAKVISRFEARVHNETDVGGAALLLQLAGSGEDERVDGSRSIDDYLYAAGDA